MDAVEKLVAIEEIRLLRARYFRFVDTKDWHGFARLFAPHFCFDITADVPGCIVRDRDELIDIVSRPLAGAVTVHHGHCAEIEILSPTAAQGIWAMEDRLSWPPEAASPIKTLHGFGHYFDTYERTPDGWRIKTMKLTRLHVDTEPSDKAAP